jgi:hypothetical protein
LLIVANRLVPGDRIISVLSDLITTKESAKVKISDIKKNLIIYKLNYKDNITAQDMKYF